MSWDESVFRTCYGGPTALHIVLWAMVGITTIGGGYGLVALVPFLVRRESRRHALAFLGSVTVAAVLGQILKLVIRRVRPCDALSIEALTSKHDGFSFPSGHALGSGTAAGFIAATLVLHALRRPERRNVFYLYAALAIVFALLVSFSRVYLGVHWPTDVLAGLSLGLTCGAIGARVFDGAEQLRSARDARAARDTNGRPEASA